MALVHYMALGLLSALSSLDTALSAVHVHNSFPTLFVAPRRHRLSHVDRRKRGVPVGSIENVSVLSTVLSVKPDETTGANNYPTNESATELEKAIATNNLQSVLDYLRFHAGAIPRLDDSQLGAIFDAVEVATSKSDENTVNKRAIDDANIVSATSAVEFQRLDRVRAQMTQLYQLLSDEGRLRVFGAAGRPTSDDPSVTFPATGSKLISPSLLEKITEMSMTNLTPKPTNLLLYGGVALALLEGVASLYFQIDFNALVAATLLLSLADQLLVSGAVFETATRMLLPETKRRVTYHEAGHFLCAYLLGCPVEGVVLSTWAALRDGRFGGRTARAVSAGTSYYDLDLSEQIAGWKPLTRDSIDRYSVIVMGGIAAEALEFGRADGGAGDEEALIRFLRSLNPRGGNAVRAWSPDLIRNQARWGATQAVLLLKEYKPCYDALVDALERGGDLGMCVAAIESAARREGLGRLASPVGLVSEEGDSGRWVTGLEMERTLGKVNGSVNNKTPPNTSNDAKEAPANTVPTYGEDPITSTEQFLQQYREAMNKKLQTIDKQLEQLDEKAIKTDD